MTDLKLDPKTTALVAIDLQRSNVARQLAPHSAQDVVSNSRRLADALRAAGGTVVRVRVLVHEIARWTADQSLRPADAPPPPPDASELVPEAGIEPADLIVTKRQWGAFFGTDLELHLRRRGIRTLVMAGIATNFGVESTARAALDQGYDIVFAEDAMSSMRAELHEFAVRQLFPFMGRVRSTQAVIGAL
ncbi:MAG: isochorismatase family protein [Telluria sp.]